MDALGMLNALIGVVLVYFVLSLVVTAFVEWWQQLFVIRGQVLAQSVASLFDEQLDAPTGLLEKSLPADAPGQCLTARFFQHQRIWSLAESRRKLPSYLDERTLSEVFVEVAVRASGADLRLANLLGAPAQLRQALVAIPRPALRDALLDLFDTANGEPEAFLRGVQAWTHEVGQRATGWLRRRIMPVTFIVSLAVAVIANADTVRIFQQLTRDPSLAQTIADKAENVAASERCESQQAQSETCARLDYAKRLAVDVAPVLGWEGDPLALALQTGAWPAVKGNPAAVVGKVTGILLSTFALMLGAPFWFDVLQKLVKVRSSVRPEGRAQDGAAADANATRAAGAGPAGPTSPAAAPTTEAPDKLPFKTTATRVHLPTALWLSRASDAAYLSSRQAVETSLGNTFLLPYEELDASRSHTQFALLERADLVVLAFRGTEAIVADWHTDARFELVEAGWGEQRRVHRGFRDALEVVWPRLRANLLKALATPRPLWITGHSLGGALAALAAHRLLTDEQVSVSGLCTFGQPRCGDAQFCKDLDDRLAGRYWRAVNYRDPVPRVPLERMGYGRHAGTLLYFDTFGRLAIDPAWWLRQLDFLALPESPEQLTPLLKAAVADHSLYSELLFKALSTQV